MGGRGAYSKISNEVEYFIRDIDWEQKCSMSLKDARKEVNKLLVGKKIETEIYGPHSTGEIRFNSNGRNNILTNKHSDTSEKKWVVQKFQESFKELNVEYSGFEPLRMDSHNLAKKLKWNYKGFNKYQFEYKGKKWQIKTAVVGDNWFEEPYYIREI